MPYLHLFYVNIILVILFSVFLILIKIKFPKLRINLFILLIIISLLSLISVLRPGSYQSGDLSLHSAIAIPFYDTLKEGNIIPRWGGSLCSGYGCPDFIFMYSLPYYLVSIFHFIGFSFINSVKLLIITTFVLSGIGMYKLLEKELGDKAAFVAGIIYLFSPYHLVDTHFRIDVAELCTFAILPYVILLLKKYIEKNSFRSFIPIVFSLVFLVMSHQSLALISLPFIFLYSCILIIKKSGVSLARFALGNLPFVAAFLVSSFYWLPIIYESRFLEIGRQQHVSFATINELLFSPWKFGFLFQGPIGQLSYLIGYVQLLILFLITFLVIIKKKFKYKSLTAFLLMLTYFFIFMMTSYSSLLWKSIPFLSYIQLATRVLVFVNFLIAICAAILIKNLNKNWLVIAITGLAILSTILNWGNRASIRLDDHALRNGIQRGSPGVADLTKPVWVKGDIPKPQFSRIEVIKGTAIVEPLSILTTKHTYYVIAKTNTVLKENTFFFPGWKVFANNKPVKIEYENSDFPGIITFGLPRGIYKINVVFQNSPIRNIGDSISIITIIVICIGFIYLKLKKKNLKVKHSKV